MTHISDPIPTGNCVIAKSNSADLDRYPLFCLDVEYKIIDKRKKKTHIVFNTANRSNDLDALVAKAGHYNLTIKNDWQQYKGVLVNDNADAD
jgi:hypothetical protein